MIDYFNEVCKDSYYICSGCGNGVKGKSLVSFEAFSVPMRVCTKCCKEALKNITEALERRNGK